MRGRGLKTLMLPQMVEAQKKEESELLMDSPKSIGHGAHLSRSSTSSDFSSPTTPTFSLRGHSRLPSSTSSIASSPNMRESMDGFGAVNRPLTDVKEEPQERDEDQEMVNAWSEHPDLEDRIPSRLSDYGWNVDYSGALPSPTGYDLADEYSLENDFAPNPCAKRRRNEDVSLSPINGLTSRFGTRMPSLSRKWRSRKTSPTIAMPDRAQESSLSRANSIRSRAPSLAGSLIEAAETRSEKLPPTPARSIFDGDFEEPHLSIDTEKANAHHDDTVDLEAKPTTPLLPPIMTQIPAHIKEVPYQSPLQSPTVADPEASSVLNSPLPTPRIAGLPSPPLSGKPSLTSFGHQRGLSPTSPSSEIPPMLITDPNDQWANQLGHANFTIIPEPYIADQPSLFAYKQLRSDWDSARCNYMKHLVRTGEHWGATSKIYRLTEEKWIEIDATWKLNADLCLSRIAGKVNDIAMSLSISEVTPEPAPLMKMPALNGPKSEGKFPKLGDEGIVGPMEQIASPRQQSQRRKRKLGFFRWVQGVWPAGVGVFGRSTSSGP